MNQKVLEFHVDKNSKVFDDCRSYSFINLLQYHGMSFQIDELLGFGGGITFDLINISNNKLSLYYPCGKSSDELIICCKKFGIDAIRSQFRSNITQGEMFEEISNLINKGFPVVVNADRFYLDYLDIPRGHIGLHTIIIYGCDKDKLNLFLVDMFAKNLYETANIEMVYNAVMSQKQIPTERKYYYIRDGYDVKIEKEKVYGEIILEHCKNALENSGYLDNLGKFIDNLNHLKFQSSENRLIDKFLDKQLDIIINTVKMLENSGTFYRATYSKFIINLLKEFGYSAEMTNEIESIFLEIYENLFNSNVSLGITEKISFLERFRLLETKLFRKLEGLQSNRC